MRGSQGHEGKQKMLGSHKRISVDIRKRRSVLESQRDVFADWKVHKSRQLFPGDVQTEGGFSDRNQGDWLGNELEDRRIDTQETQEKMLRIDNFRADESGFPAGAENRFSTSG